MCVLGPVGPHGEGPARDMLFWRTRGVSEGLPIGTFSGSTYQGIDCKAPSLGPFLKPSPQPHLTS